jgi:hypothetical protein
MKFFNYNSIKPSKISYLFMIILLKKRKSNVYNNAERCIKDVLMYLLAEPWYAYTLYY